MSYRILSAFIAFAFGFTSILSPAYAQTIASLNLPVPGAMVSPSPAFVPVLLKGMTIHPDDPLKFDFIIDSGNTDFDETRIKDESQRLVKYFLASMTIPKDDLWVNLSPYESDKIIPEELGKTELGRDMLAQDYILKQLTASLMYPEKELGKEFWNKVYQKAQEKYGTNEIPVDTFNKVWILPETATVYEHGQTVYIVDAKLKVMLDSDYEAMQHETKDQRLKTKDFRSNESSVISLQSSVSSEIIKEIILPEIEREVNEGQNFAPLRQIYHSLILAKWYKETIKESLLSKVYVDKKLINGIRLEDGQLKREDGSIIDSQFSIVDQIYNQYMEAYKKGVFNYIKEDYDRLSNEIIPRKYFSGGIDRLTNFGMVKLERIDDSGLVSSPVGKDFEVEVSVSPQKGGPSSPIYSEGMRQHMRRVLKKYRKDSDIGFSERERSLRALEKFDHPDAVAVLALASKLRERIPPGEHYVVEEKVLEFLPIAKRFQDEGYSFKINHDKEEVYTGYELAWDDPFHAGSGERVLQRALDAGSLKGKVAKPEKIEIVRGKKFTKSSSPITPQEARALIEGKLAPEHHHLINDTHVQLAMAYEGDFEVVYHAGPLESIEIIRGKKLDQSQSSSLLSLAEARALIEERLASQYPDHPEYKQLISDEAIDSIAGSKGREGRIDITYYEYMYVTEGHFDEKIPTNNPEMYGGGYYVWREPNLSITFTNRIDEESSSLVNSAFMDEMRQEAAELGISLEAGTKIAVFIGGKQILSDHYYQMFKDVVRRNFKFDLVYLPFVIEEGEDNSDERIQLIKEQLDYNPQVVGATITRPWKGRFFEDGDNEIGAVNYILKDQNGQLRRTATDGPTWIDGLNDDLRAQKILEGPEESYDFQNKKIVILGSGGSARELADTLNGKLKGPEAKITFTDTDESKRTSLKETLDRLNPTYATVFLAPDDLSNLRRAIREADILINATGVGRGETEGQSPLSPYLFAEARHDLIVSDLISNTDTQMLKDARETGPEGIKTFYGRSMYIRGMAHFIKGWMEQANGGEQYIPSEQDLYQAIIQSESTPKEIFQMAWVRFGYNEYPYHIMGDLVNEVRNLKREGKISKVAGEYDDALKAAIAFTETKIVPDVYVVDTGKKTFGAEWMDRSFGLREEEKERGIYIEQSLLDYIKDKEDPADMLARVFVYVLTTGSIAQKRKAQFEYAKAKFPRLIHHLLDPVNGGTKNIEEVLWDVRDNVLGLMKADHVRDSLGDIGVPYTIEKMDVEKQQEIKRHAEELADIAESALHKIAINVLNKTIDLDIYQRMHLNEHEMTAEDNVSVGMLALAANPPTLAHALVAALKAMAESNSDIFYVSATFSDFRKPWLRTTFEKRQDISSDSFGMLSGGLIKVMPRLPHDDGLNGEEKVLPILDIFNGAGSVKLWYGAGDDHYFAFAFKDGKVKFDEIVTEGNKRNYNDFAYYVSMPGYKNLLEKLLGEYRSTIPLEHISMIEKIVQAKNPEDVLAEALKKGETPGEKKSREEKVFFPVLDTIGKLWLIQDKVNRGKETGQYSTDFTLGMVNTLRLGIKTDGLRKSLDFPVTYNPGASFEIASTKLRNGVIKLIKDREIDLVLFEAMSKGLLKQLLSPTSGDRQYLYSLVRSDKGLIAAKAVETLFPLNDKKENARHQKLMDQLKADLSAVVPDAVVDERPEGDISKITVSDAGRMKDLIQYTYSVHNGLFPDGLGKEIVLVGNIRVGEDVSAQLKDDLLKAITRYVRAYNYADGFMGLQDVLIKDLVRRDKKEGELKAGDADVIMIPGNDDLNVYQKALDLLSRGVGKYLLISGERGRLTEDIKKMADANGFEVEMATEAEMIHSIMIQMAEQNPQWRGLVDDLKGDNVVILDKEARYTVENFKKAREKLEERGLLDVWQRLKVLYMQKPLQQLRTKGAFNSVFIEELLAGKIDGISYTTDYVKEANTPSDIVAEYFRIIANYQRKRKVGNKEIGDWEIDVKEGLKFIPDSHWAYASLLFKELTPEEKQKLVNEMRVNIKDMKIDDRTVLYKGLPKEAKELAKEIYAYRSVSSPVVTTMEEGRRTQDEVGGIDMNDIDMNHQGTGVDIQFDPVELQEMIDAGVDGFTPVIINIMPLPSILPLLGLEPAIKEESTEVSLSST